MINIGKLGIWFSHNPMSIAESVAFAQQVEACGYGALWIPEAIGREPLVHLAYLARCPFHKFATSNAAERLYGLGG